MAGRPGKKFPGASPGEENFLRFTAPAVPVFFGGAMLTCGVDIGGSKISFGMVEDGAILRKSAIPNRFFGDPDAMVGAIARGIHALCGGEPLQSIGAGSPGWVIDGLVLDAVNLGIARYPLQDKLKSALGIPVYVENDARCALVAELSGGALRDCVNGALVTFGTGVGGGLVIGKKLYKGSFGYAGEIGHMALESRGECPCGKRGCYELTGAVPSLLRLSGELGLPARDAREVFEAALSGDARAKEALEAYLPLAARGVTELAMLLDLDTICIGGGISARHDLFVRPLEKLVYPWNPRCRIVPADLGNDAGIIGAARLPA